MPFGPKRPRHVRHIGHNGRPIGRTDGDIETIDAVGREDAGVVGNGIATMRRIVPARRTGRPRVRGNSYCKKHEAQEDYRPAHSILRLQGGYSDD